MAKHLTGLGCKVKVGLPDKDGADVADWLQHDDKDAVAEKIQDLLEPYVPEMDAGVQQFAELKHDFADMDHTTPAPAVLVRSDGATILYAGRLNGLFGQPGSGKTWVALAMADAAIAQGRHCIWLDFEDNPQTFYTRAMSIGLDPVAHEDNLAWLPPALMEQDYRPGFRSRRRVGW